MPEQTPMACPICGRVITETQRLSVSTAPGRNYWVTWHFYKGDTKPDGTKRDGRESPAFVEHGEPWFNWCGRADIQAVALK